MLVDKRGTREKLGIIAGIPAHRQTQLMSSSWNKIYPEVFTAAESSLRKKSQKQQPKTPFPTLTKQSVLAQ